MSGRDRVCHRRCSYRRHCFIGKVVMIMYNDVYCLFFSGYEMFGFLTGFAPLDYTGCIHGL